VTPKRRNVAKKPQAHTRLALGDPESGSSSAWDLGFLDRELFNQSSGAAANWLERDLFRALQGNGQSQRHSVMRAPAPRREDDSNLGYATDGRSAHGEQSGRGELGTPHTTSPTSQITAQGRDNDETSDSADEVVDSSDELDEIVRLADAAAESDDDFSPDGSSESAESSESESSSTS